MAGLPVAARLYLTVVVTAALGVAGFTLAVGSTTFAWGYVLVLALLFHYCEVSPVRLTVHHARASMSYAVGVASAVLLGPGAAALIGLTAVASLQPDLPAVKRAFNGAQFALSGFVAAVVFAGLDPGWAGTLTERTYLAFGAALVAYVVVNLVLVAGMLLLSRQATTRQLRRELRHLALPTLGNGAFGLVLVGLWPSLGPYAALLVLVPLITARWALAVPYAEAKACEAAIAAICQAVETKDPYTRGHCLRVGEGAVLIAEQLGLEPRRIEALRYAGLVHDVGKTAVPTAILQKPGKPTEEEWAALQLHPWYGSQLIKDIAFLREAVGGVMHHHERVDGSGYPLGLAGEEIPEFARIIAVADFFDAVTTERPYHRPWPREKALAELQALAGTHFDPRMVAAFVRAMEMR
ncbi:HD-GYP domain-containing protein [Thermoactinospora rubra]|uniref:HD-GYP domain-containing protein n=1 Tax=Thermoactinospora rubra TaxID=1088767 RepID=UPI000A111D2F|nr:HD-GYP domain-containing protein [Thermoactinospora rubra]